MSARASVAGALCWAFATVAALAAPTSDATFRVFLHTGHALPSYGEPAEVGDRVIFTLVMGESATRLHLVDLPVAAIDLDRTRRYTRAVRADAYARGRAELDYQAVTAEVARTLDSLASVSDPALRLAVAERARARLAEWAGRSYGYRAADVGTLLELFDGVIGELGAAVGGAGLAFDLTSGADGAAAEVLLPAPDLRESIRVALAAATVADDGPSRLALLRSARAVVPAAAAFEDLRREVNRRLDLEAAADAAYAALADDLLQQATRFLEAADAEAIAALHIELTARDAVLGAARPRVVARLRRALGTLSHRALEYRAALDHYALVRADRLAFERRVRPVLSALDGLAPVLTAIRAESGPRYRQLLGVEARVDELAVALNRTDPPDGLRDVHATLASAVEMARQASARRRLSIVTDRAVLSGQASAAAAGSLLLARQARETLVSRLFPPVLGGR